MNRKLRTLHRDEHGAAIALVLLVGVVLVLLSSVMIARGMRQLVNTAGDTNWDNGLFAAEAGLDQGLQVLDRDFAFTTGETIPVEVVGTAAEGPWAVAAADARSAADVVVVSEGEYVVVRPANSTMLLAVGYAPSRSATERRVRVIRASVDAVPWIYEVEHALLVGGNLEVSGNTTITDISANDGAAVHANGTIGSSGSYVVEGCVTASATTFAATAQCPPSPAPVEPLPVIEPLAMYPFAHFVLCDDQLVYGGPAHAATPDPDLVPCSGNETVVALAGWTAKLQGGVVGWTTGPSASTGGVFYIDNGNFSGKLGDSALVLEASLIVANGQGSGCAMPATGNIEIGANSSVVRHASLAAAGYDITLVAQGDVAFNGSATFGGAILAHEQIRYQGTADSWGPVVAVDACDTPGSPISKNSTSSTTGNATINFAGPVSTPFFANTLRAEVVGWYEL